MCNLSIRHYEEQFCEIILNLNLNQWFRHRCLLKTFLIWSSGGPFVGQSITICAIVVKGIMRNNFVIYFAFWPVVQEEMSFRHISYLELWWPFCSVERNHLGNYGKGHYEKQFCGIN